MDKQLIIPIVLIILMACTIAYVYPILDSYENGISIPSECSDGFAENMTYAGQTISHPFWSKKCCTTRIVGYLRTRVKVCWSKNDVKGEQSE